MFFNFMKKNKSLRKVIKHTKKTAGFNQLY